MAKSEMAVVEDWKCIEHETTDTKLQYNISIARFGIAAPDLGSGPASRAERVVEGLRLAIRASEKILQNGPRRIH